MHTLIYHAWEMGQYLEGYNHGVVEGTAIAFIGDTEEDCKEPVRLADRVDKVCSMH
jgi:hypothetical protein